MIKFIATDLDGTLLNNNKELPHDFGKVIDELDKRGIQFAISSGRQYDTILRQFKEYVDRITIIAENGAIVFRNGQLVHYDTLPSDDAAEIVKALKGAHGIHPIACGVNGAFGEPVRKEFYNEISVYYIKYKTVSDLAETVKSEELLKFAIFDSVNAEQHCYALLEKFHDTHNVLISGEHWVDVMSKGITKGSAIEKLQQLYGYKPEECMAFGDFMNDADMMRVCFHSYAMENAHPDLKALCRFSAPSNEDEGVTKTIKRVVL